ncbi:sn-glycerol-3-phosphate ABC transporter permease component [Mesoplasma florum W37]|uniref:carbohydrate ABC transporter permease n=1 Tax=Mesoplasma florum TaxID=2151 RepID=UPI0003B92AC0|nr:carbohydrate ABC transporter permease [Mesoplasma florum]AGY41099.1 sn-glycerol-3-phosphate ABC transporter permease component [Mesoplasma florum W37]AVN59331.1 carbohydrate ABC transporter permease [Mesoplasma florum]AVN60712.1 carbohydrate ABC transporter permease [Mesoplasma florum]
MKNINANNIETSSLSLKGTKQKDLSKNDLRKMKYEKQIKEFEIKTNLKEEKIVLSTNFFKALIFKINLFFFKKFMPKKINYSNFLYVRRTEKIKKKTLKLAGDIWYKNIFSTSINWTILIVMFVIMIFPFYWMLITSFKSYSEVDPSIKRGFWEMMWPESWSLQVYRDMFEFVNTTSSNKDITFSRFFFNSFFIAILSTGIQLIVSIIGGFAIYNWRTKFNSVFMIIMFSIMMVPGEAMLLGRYTLMVQLGWMNTLMALIVPFIGNVFTMYLMSNAFYALNKDLKRAAKMDGLNSMQYFLKIALPAISATIITSFIISFIESWNSVLWPITVMRDDTVWKTIPMMLYKMMQVSGIEPEIGIGYNPMNMKMAASFIAILPMLVVFIVFNKWIINGLSKRGSSGSKG